MSKIYDAIMGFVVGDALGVPFEFKTRDTFKCNDMVGFGTHAQPAGTWSDDSSLMLATIKSIIKCGGIDYDDMMKRFSKWHDKAKYTPYGEVFDCGNTVAAAIHRYNNGSPSLLWGDPRENANGNGSLMRILPLAFIDNITDLEIKNVSALTHANDISLNACVIYVRIAQELLKNHNILWAIKKVAPYEKPFGKLTHLQNIFRDDIKSSGYVVDTLEAALWCVINNNYRDTVLTAVNLGEDTDTIAAVAGGLAGIIYGAKDIPEEWIKKIPRLKWIKKMLNHLEP